MKPEDCPELETCYKIEIILDKDILDFQINTAIRSVCARCEQYPETPLNNPPIEKKRIEKKRIEKKRIARAGARARE